MKRRFFFPVLSVLTFVSCHPSGNPKTVGEAVKPISSVFDEYTGERRHLFPLEATENGDYRYDSLFPNDISEAYRDTERIFYKKYIDLLKGYDRTSLNENDQLSYDILMWDLKVNLEGMKFHDYLMPISQFWSTPLNFGQLGSGQSTQPFRNTKDYEDFLKRMEGFKVWCDTAVENMKRGISTGYTLPKILAQRVEPQFSSMIVSDPTQSIFYAPVKNFPKEISAADQKRLDSLYKNAIMTLVVPSYKKMYDFIKNDYEPKCRTTSGIGALPDGKEYYSYLIKLYTTTDMTPDQVFDLGQSEVKRIRAEMESVKEEVGFKGDLKAFFRYVSTDKKFFPFKTPQEVLDKYEEIHKRMQPQLDKMFDHVPKTKFEIREMEKFREASGSEEYQSGTPDGKRPGIFYVPIPDVHKYIDVIMESMFLHEAIPGHHFQQSLQRENTSLYEFRKFYWNSAYGEGWALYTESLGKELGLYTDPYQHFGALSKEMHRALRLVVDVGLHEKGWTREQAIQFMCDNEGETKEKITIEVERYMAVPGQALSYKIGQLKILELRAKAEKELGSKFNIAKFHDAVLLDGVLPLSVLETKIDKWIEDQKKN